MPERLRDDNGFWPKQRKRERERERESTIQRANAPVLSRGERAAARGRVLRGNSWITKEKMAILGSRRKAKHWITPVEGGSDRMRNINIRSSGRRRESERCFALASHATRVNRLPRLRGNGGSGGGRKRSDTARSGE